MYKRFSGTVGLIIGMVLVGTGMYFATTVQAASVRYVDASADGNGDGTSWSDAFPTLTEALAAAEGGDEIWVANGTYTPTSTSDRTISFVIPSDISIYGGFAGDETSRDQRDSDPATNGTVLSGDIGVADDNSDNSYHVVTATNTAVTTVLDGFTITGGNADATAPVRFGGGLLLQNSQMILANLRFTANTAGAGGAMTSQFSTPTMTTITFIGNTATDDGGALYTDNSNLILTDAIMQDNTATDGGGALYNKASAPVLTNVTITGNTARDGGATASFASNPQYINVLLGGNTATRRGGAAYHVSSNPLFVNATIASNRADSGGGLYNLLSTPSIENSIIWSNADADGTGTATASVFNDQSTPQYTASVVQGVALNGDDNLDGTQDSSAPVFVDLPAVADAPTTAGDYQLSSSSPLIDMGDDAANSTTVDLMGNPRKVDFPTKGRSTASTIDLGAYEVAAPPVPTATPTQSPTPTQTPPPAPSSDELVYLPLVTR